MGTLENAHITDWPTLLAASEEIRASAVRVQLDLGLTFCRIAQQLRPSVTIERSLSCAQRAYETAVEHMVSLSKGGKEFDQVTAAAERLKFELENLSRTPPTSEGGINALVIKNLVLILRTAISSRAPTGDDRLL